MIFVPWLFNTSVVMRLKTKDKDMLLVEVESNASDRSSVDITHVKTVVGGCFSLENICARPVASIIA